MLALFLTNMVKLLINDHEELPNYDEYPFNNFQMTGWCVVVCWLLVVVTLADNANHAQYGDPDHPHQHHHQPQPYPGKGR